MIRKQTGPDSSASKTFTTFGWSSAAAALASRKNRLRIELDSSASGRGNFIARGRSRFGSKTLKTWPNPPDPRGSITSNRPMRLASSDPAGRDPRHPGPSCWKRARRALSESDEITAGPADDGPSPGMGWIESAGVMGGSL